MQVSFLAAALIIYRIYSAFSSSDVSRKSGMVKELAQSLYAKDAPADMGVSAAAFLSHERRDPVF